MHSHGRISAWVPRALGDNERVAHMRATARSFNDVFLSRVHCQPEVGKWTKFCDSLDFIFVAATHNGILNRVLRTAGEGQESGPRTQILPRFFTGCGS